jgi:hypothetical protein
MNRQVWCTGDRKEQTEHERTENEGMEAVAELENHMEKFLAGWE